MVHGKVARVFGPSIDDPSLHRDDLSRQTERSEALSHTDPCRSLGDALSAWTIRAGDPVPWFEAPSSAAPSLDLGVMAGRYVVLCFLGSAGEPSAAAALRVAVDDHRHLFDDRRASLFGITIDPDDRRLGRLRQSLPGIRHYWDFDGTVSRLYGALQAPAHPDALHPAPGDPSRLGAGHADTKRAASRYEGFWLVLDPMLRVLTAAPLAQADAVMRFVAALPPCDRHAGQEVPAPVLMLPRVLEPDFCRHLIALYEADGGRSSGFMLDRDGATGLVRDADFKVRRDCEIRDEATRTALRQRIERRLVPELHKAFQFAATRLERYIVACYDAAEGGHFAAHRDNTTKGTAHRRFAVTVNLNDDYEGGALCFPEFGTRQYRPPVGGAIVFSCALLHQVMPVTRGLRYATVPFLHDEAAEAVFQQNRRFLDSPRGPAHGDRRSDRDTGLPADDVRSGQG
jgi:predicted 2-oxoglutarate/Fe(II)-dependent dioxygenase YbiX/peroxiredoxin